jgi:superfamily I DNA/RNA helicase
MPLQLGAKAAGAVQGFLQLIERLAADTADLPLHETVDQVLNASGLLEHYKKEKADRGEARVENLLELVSAARGFEPDEAALEPGQSRCGRSSPSSRTRCSSRARARRTPGKTASR